METPMRSPLDWLQTWLEKNTCWVRAGVDTPIRCLAKDSPWNPWIPCQLTKDSKYEMRLSCGVCWETFWHPTMNPYGSSSNQFSPKFKWFLCIFGRTPMGTPIETLMKSSCSSPWESSWKSPWGSPWERPRTYRSKKIRSGGKVKHWELPWAFHGDSMRLSEHTSWRLPGDVHGSALWGFPWWLHGNSHGEPTGLQNWLEKNTCCIGARVNPPIRWSAMDPPWHTWISCQLAKYKNMGFQSQTRKS